MKECGHRFLKAVAIQCPLGATAGCGDAARQRNFAIARCELRCIQEAGQNNIKAEGNFSAATMKATIPIRASFV
jgi:hypothetical protein